MSTSVLLLSYNDAATVAQAVTSVARQYRRAELTAVMLADDASHDDTVTRARAADLTLDVLPAQQNLGAWPNLNRALHHMSGQADWVLILHADDIATEGWADALLTRIGKCAPGVASISTSWDMQYGAVVERTGEQHTDEVRLIAGSRQAVHDTLLRGCWWKISGAAIRLRAFLEIGDFDARVAQCADWDWTMRALEKGWSFEYVPRVYTIYRQHAANLSTSALRQDVDIMDAMTMVERFGHTLGRRELVSYYARRCRYALRRFARGALRRDRKRMGTSVRTMAALSRHLVKQLAA